MMGDNDGRPLESPESRVKRICKMGFNEEEETTSERDSASNDAHVFRGIVGSPLNPENKHRQDTFPSKYPITRTATVLSKKTEKCCIDNRGVYRVYFAVHEFEFEHVSQGR